MRKNILVRLLMTVALLMFALPLVASAQIQIYGRDRNERSDRYDQYDLHDALVRLENSSARLENDLSATSMTRGRRVLGGLFWVTNSRDRDATAEVHDFRMAVRQLRRASAGGRNLSDSYDEARNVVDQGLRLDRYWRLRTGRTDVDQELSEIRSNLHVIAEAYDISVRY